MNRAHENENRHNQSEKNNVGKNKAQYNFGSKFHGDDSFENKPKTEGCRGCCFFAGRERNYVNFIY